MKLKELFTKYPDKEIIKRLIELYPDQKVRGYKVALTEIRGKNARKFDQEVVIEYVPVDKEFTDKAYFSVGCKSSDNDEVYGVSLLSWSEWLGMEIVDKNLYNLPKLDVLAHILWEMTFHGYTSRKASDFKVMMNNRMKEINEEIKNNELNK